jgi:hypothetical protein
MEFISNFSTSDIVIMGICVLVIGTIVSVALYKSPKYTILRKVKKVRRQPINSVREGEYVKIIGNAKNINEPLLAPLSKRPCVFYEVEVEHIRSEDSETIIHDIQFQDFYIQSGTDSALVPLNRLQDPAKLIHLVADHTAKSGMLKNTDANLEAFLQKHNQKSKGFLGTTKTFKYTERIIEIDEEIAVLGIGKWETTAQPKDSYSGSKTLTLSGTFTKQLMITDEPKAMKRVKRKL